MTRTTTPKVRSEIVTVTPDLAADWLGKNSHNRTIRQRTVDDLAGAITRGEWVLNGDAIRFSASDVLLDGQHRLWAIVEAGVPVDTFVITGLPDETQETMDVGARRNLKDALTLRGARGASALAAALNYKWRYDNGHVRNATVKPSTAQAIALWQEHPGLYEWCNRAQRLRDRFRVSLAMSAVALYEFESIDPDACEVFFDRLIQGVNLEDGSPILVLRRYLERNAMNAVGARASSVVTHALFIKAWNAYREGRHVEQLNWKAAGLKAEAFPVPK